MGQEFLKQYTALDEDQTALEARAKDCVAASHGFSARVCRGDTHMRLRFRCAQSKVCQQLAK